MLFFINAFNRLARTRRNLKYRRRLKNWTGLRIVAEGDSWFQYPLLLKDTIDQLNDLDKFQYAIYGLSEAGDLLANIIREDEITEAIERENPDIFLISAGGNDMVGDGRIASLVHPFSARRKAENYLNHQFDVFLTELEQHYRGLFSRLLTAYPHLKIFCHGYDKAIPQNGKWLGQPLNSHGIKSKVLQRQIIAIMIKRFNQTMRHITADFAGRVYHVNCQKLIGSKSKWHDELHPKSAGFFRVAERFDLIIQQALNNNDTLANSSAIELGTIRTDISHTEKSIKLTDMSKLNHQEFVDLVVKRAELTTGKPISRPANRQERQKIEERISDYFEKIHKQNNFLPSSFLENGVTRAQAVCRITTDINLGSGFLIAARDFIMTNNHVIPDSATAMMSIAEFDYDEDDTLYTVKLNPDKLFITNKELDFTIVACDSEPLPLSIEPIALFCNADTITRGERVNIIQHPQGRRKEISLHDNKVSYVYDKAIRYSADTEGGSSGSPVFNNQWSLVALHHAGWVHRDGSANNEGIRINAIVDFLIQQNKQQSHQQLAYLVSCIADCDTSTGKQNSPPKTSSTQQTNSLTLNIDSQVEELIIKFKPHH